MKKTGIYCIENLINHKKYIGQSVDIDNRWNKHRSDLNNCRHDNEYLQRSWNKYGEEKFSFFVVLLCDAECLDKYEVYYIDFYKTLNRDNGYNLTSGGSKNKYYSQETRKKMSNASKGREVSPDTRIKISEHHADVSGERNPMYGKPCSDKVKESVRNANKGRVSYRRNLCPVYCIELQMVFKDAAEVAKELQLNSGSILRCCRGERKTCGGYHWEFYNLKE